MVRTNSAKLPYYSYDRIFSYNATYNFVVGGRGLGKTYGAKKQAIRNFIRRGEQFIYLRRYKDELKAARNTFFADFSHEFPEHVFRINGNEAQIATAGTEKPEWKTCGYFLALSTAQSQKSVAFPMVTLIIFDEFIIEKGNVFYLPAEATAFNNFFSTVDRWKDKTRALFLANSVAISNPYFLAFDIKPSPDTEIVVPEGPAEHPYNGFIACHFADAKDFANEALKTRFGQFIQGTEYADYAVGNQFSDNHDKLLDFKPSDANYIYTIEIGTEKQYTQLSVWKQDNKYYLQRRLPKNQVMFTTIPERMDSERTLLLYNDKLLQYLRTAFRHGRMLFDEPKSRNAFLDIMNRK